MSEAYSASPLPTSPRSASGRGRRVSRERGGGGRHQARDRRVRQPRLVHHHAGQAQGQGRRRARLAGLLAPGRKPGAGEPFLGLPARDYSCPSPFPSLEPS